MLFGMISVAVTNYWPCFHTYTFLFKPFCEGNTQPPLKTLHWMFRE